LVKILLQELPNSNWYIEALEYDEPITIVQFLDRT
jgi:hypothetical protein